MAEENIFIRKKLIKLVLLIVIMFLCFFAGNLTAKETSVKEAQQYFENTYYDRLSNDCLIIKTEAQQNEEKFINIYG